MNNRNQVDLFCESLAAGRGGIAVVARLMFKSLNNAGILRRVVVLNGNDGDQPAEGVDCDFCGGSQFRFFLKCLTISGSKGLSCLLYTSDAADD